MTAGGEKARLDLEEVVGAALNAGMIAEDVRETVQDAILTYSYAVYAERFRIRTIDPDFPLHIKGGEWVGEPFTDLDEGAEDLLHRRQDGERVRIVRELPDGAIRALAPALQQRILQRAHQAVRA